MIYTWEPCKHRQIHAIWCAQGNHPTVQQYFTTRNSLSKKFIEFQKCLNYFQKYQNYFLKCQNYFQKIILKMILKEYSPFCDKVCRNVPGVWKLHPRGVPVLDGCSQQHGEYEISQLYVIHFFCCTNVGLYIILLFNKWLNYISF